MKPILCVDFDGVIHSYTSGWKGAEQIPDPPVPGAIQWLNKASEWWDVRIYSSRSKDPFGLEAMKDYVFNHALHIYSDTELAHQFMNKIQFCHEKPAAFLTIDDRAICFEGDWAKLDPHEMLTFQPWNKRGDKQ